MTTTASVPATPQSIESLAIGEALSESGISLDDTGSTQEPAAPELNEEEGGELEGSDSTDVDDEGSPDEAAEGKTDEDTITVTDAKGTRQIKIDYKDKAKIKRAYEQAAGVEKLYGRFKEVKDELKALKESQSSVKEKVESYQKLEALYGDGSYEGQKRLITQLTKGDLVGFAKQVLAEQESYEKLTPSERKALEIEQENSKWKSEADTLKAEMAKIRTEAALQRSQSALESVWPEFSFKGKLGDRIREEKLDEFLFRGVQSRLAEAEEQGYPVTADLIRATLKDVAGVIPGAIHQEARRLASTNKKGVAAQAKKAAQKATISSSSRAASGSMDDKDIDWGNTAQVSAFMEQQLSRR